MCVGVCVSVYVCMFVSVQVCVCLSVIVSVGVSALHLLGALLCRFALRSFCQSNLFGIGVTSFFKLPLKAGIQPENPINIQ